MSEFRASVRGARYARIHHGFAYGYAAGASFFDLSERQSKYLFDYDAYPNPNSTTRCEVVARIEEMIANERAKTTEAG